jgi:hypothetical protein
MFERSEIWERTTECVWVYVLFRDLRTGLFHVQQANAFYGDDVKTTKDALERMHLTEHDLFAEECPSERSKGFPTAFAAVEHHKAEFADIT